MQWKMALIMMVNKILGFQMLEPKDTPTNLANQVKVRYAHNQSRSVQLQGPERAHQNKAQSW